MAHLIMAKSLPPLGWLRSFEAAARHLSFTAAADELGLTQSAVSQQVKSLETRLGVPLFLRRARGLDLTDAGRRLLPNVEVPLLALETAMVGMDRTPPADLLTIATSVSVAHWVIAPLLPRFRSRHPNLKVRLLSAIWPDDYHTLRADIEIRFGSAQQVGTEAKAILPDRLIAVKSPTVVGWPQEMPLIEAVGTSSGWRSWAKAVEPVPDPACTPTPTAWHYISPRSATASPSSTNGWPVTPCDRARWHLPTPHRSPLTRRITCQSLPKSRKLQSCALG